MERNTILLIDGDVLAYQSCRPRWEKLGFQPYSTDGKRMEIEWSIEEDKEYLEESWETFQKKLDDLQTRFFTEEYVMAVKGPDNFRNIVFPDYKSNRNNDKRISNIFVPMLRKRAVEHGFAIESIGREADDLLRIWSEECIKDNREYIVCTIDKDLKCIPGKFYNMKYDEVIEISEIEAKRHYYEQLLKGDPTDFIPGLPRIGPKKAEKMLQHCVTEEEMQEEVLGQYIIHYGDDWMEYLSVMER